MRKAIRYLVLLMISQVLVACEMASASKESAAQIPTHSEESLAELKQSARTLFGGREVSIGANAFSNSNQLLIQRKAIRLPDGSVIDTRVDESPITLELVLRGEGCYLRNKNTAEEVHLIKAECIAM